MGLAASQARFLSLTARLSNLEYEGQQINQARSELADKTAKAAADYQRAMTNRILLFDSERQAFNENNNYEIFTYDTIVNSVADGGLDMRLVDANGRVVVPSLPEGIDPGSQEADGYFVDDEVFNSRYLEECLRNKGWNLQQRNGKDSYQWKSVAWNTIVGLSDVTDFDAIEGLTEEEKAAKNAAELRNILYTKKNDDGELEQTQLLYHDIITDEMLNGLGMRVVNTGGKIVVPKLPSDVAPGSEEAKKYAIDDKINDPEHLEEKLRNGEYAIQKYERKDYTGTWMNTDWRSTAGVFDVLDKSDDGEAEATYERLTALYQAEDKKLEMRQKQIDSEHSAVQTEYDALKKVIDKNVETSFKTFG